MRQSKLGDDPYAKIVEHYDLEHDRHSDDLALIAQLVETVGDPVLELACGSGRVLSHVAAAGRRVTGVDSSEAMLEAARIRLAGSGDRVDLIQADMSLLPLPDCRFGVIVLALNGLLHATTQSLQRQVLSEAFRCLDPRGMLCLDIANPIVCWPTAGLQPVLLEGQWVNAAGAAVQKFQSVTVDPARQLVNTRLWYDITDSFGTLRRQSMTFDLRYIHAAELQLLLELAGFVEWQIYGDYELGPFAAESPRIIALAEKTRSR